MRAHLLIFGLLAAAPFCGCGEANPPLPLPPKGAAAVGPHGAIAYPLPDGLGFAELVNEPAADLESTAPTSIVVYFLGPDAKAALSPPPKEARFRVDARSKKGQSVSLKAEPRADDPAGAGRFASNPGPYRLDDLRGVLTATVGGKPATIAFAPR